MNFLQKNEVIVLLASKFMTKLILLLFFKTKSTYLLMMDAMYDTFTVTFQIIYTMDKIQNFSWCFFQFFFFVIYYLTILSFLTNLVSII